MAQHDDNRWHLDKRVPISIIIVLVLQAVTALWAIAEIKKDVEVLKSSVAAQRDRDDRQDTAVAGALALVRSDIKELGAKIDRLIERPR